MTRVLVFPIGVAECPPPHVEPVPFVVRLHLSMEVGAMSTDAVERMVPIDLDPPTLDELVLSSGSSVLIDASLDVVRLIGAPHGIGFVKITADADLGIGACQSGVCAATFNVSDGSALTFDSSVRLARCSPKGGKGASCPGRGRKNSAPLSAKG